MRHIFGILIFYLCCANVLQAQENCEDQLYADLNSYYSDSIEESDLIVAMDKIINSDCEAYVKDNARIFKGRAEAISVGWKVAKKTLNINSFESSDSLILSSVYYERAFCLKDEGNLIRALKNIKRAISITPSSGYLHLQMVIEYRRGRYKEVDEILSNESFTLHDESTDYVHNIALFKIGEYAKADSLSNVLLASPSFSKSGDFPFKHIPLLIHYYQDNLSSDEKKQVLQTDLENVSDHLKKEFRKMQRKLR